MDRPNPDKIKEVFEGNIAFLCGGCGHKFNSKYTTWTPKETKTHPFQYFAVCPECNELAEQEAWQQAQFCILKKRGAKSEAGKKIISKNFPRMSTPNKKFARFYNKETGRHSRVSTYYPAKPGRYKQCKNCDIPHDECEENIACLKRMELFFYHHIAVETGDVKLLDKLHADFQSNIFAIVDDMVSAIVSEGVLLESENGEKIANPLIREITNIMKANGLTLKDMGLTRQGQQEMAILNGFLNEEKKDSIIEFQKQQLEAIKQLPQLINESKVQVENDQILIEYKHENNT